MSVEYDENSVKGLVGQFINGDKETFSAIYDGTILIVYRTVALLLKNKLDTSDVVQDIYVELFRSLHSFDINRSFKLWLLGLVYRKVSSYQRKVWLSFRLLDKLSKQVHVEQSTYEHVGLDFAERESIAVLLDALPYKQRQVIVLKYYHDLSQEAIAKIVGIPVGTVKSRLHAALRTLRGEYRELYQLLDLGSVK